MSFECLLHGLCSQPELGYANARTMKEVADAIVESYMIRVSREREGKERLVLLEDVKAFVWKRIVEKRGIGFK